MESKMTNVVPLVLVPVHGQLGTNCAVTRGSTGTTVVRVGTAAASRTQHQWTTYMQDKNLPPRKGGLAKGLGTDIAGDLALVRIHVDYSSSVYMDSDGVNKTYFARIRCQSGGRNVSLASLHSGCMRVPNGSRTKRSGILPRDKRAAWEPRTPC